nr:PREDICTED: protein piccolo-like [Bemisia tabaci]
MRIFFSFIFRSWNVVLFEDGRCGIAPTNWLTPKRDRCAYPKVNSFALNKLIQAATEVKDDWSSYLVRKFYAENLLTFKEARAALDSVDSDVREIENMNPSPQPVLPQPALPQPVLPQPVLPQPVLPQPVLPQPVQPQPVLPQPVQPQPALSQPVENFNTDGEAVTVSSQCLRQLFKVTLQNQAQLKALNESRSQSQTYSTSNSATPVEEAVPILSACPLKSTKDFKKLEKALGEDTKVRKQLREELQLHMKKNPKESCRNLARCLIADELAQKFSWKGRPMKNQPNPKGAFEGTCLSKQIYQAVNAKFPSEKMTVDTYQRNLENWFIQAKTRLQRSEERRAARAARLSVSQLDLSSESEAEET